ncbi:MAG TPA: hypothetical protein VHR43_07615, partial [Gemmatimonadales bacterium]|nr:hypothetical protein [Gemmatimonadales bacterium]
MRFVLLLLAVSAASLAVVRVGEPPPSSPTEFVLPSATALVARAGPAGLTIQWSAVPGARSYRVFRSTRVPAPSLVAILPGEQHRFEDNGLAPGGTYAYRIVAYADPDLLSGPIGAFTGQGTTLDACRVRVGP